MHYVLNMHLLYINYTGNVIITENILK